MVPAGYISGAPLSDTATYAGQSFATLGLTPSAYVYTFSGVNADTFTVEVAAPVGVAARSPSRPASRCSAPACSVSV